MSVPQGSAGGPVFYNLYVASLADVIPEDIDLIGFAHDYTLMHDRKKETTEMSNLLPR